MYEPTKDLKKASVRANVSQLVDDTRTSATDIADDARASAARLGSKVQERGREAGSEVLNVINSLKALIAQYTDFDRASDIKNQLVDRASEWKGVVQDEVVHAYQVGRDRTVQTVQDRPLTSVAVALGAGILLGYILGAKQSYKNY